MQLDNCVRENKSKFVLSFLALMVELGAFEEVSELRMCESYKLKEYLNALFE